MGSMKDFQELKKFCESEDNVRLAFLFGSAAAGMSGEDSDADIGVLLRDGTKDAELWVHLSGLVDKDVDLVDLNEAPATLISTILKTGLPLVIKDRDAYWRLMPDKTLEAEDFGEFGESYWRTYQRSRPLAPEDKTRLIERVQFLTSELQDIEVFNTLTYSEYLEDKMKRRNIERWTENVVNATMDIAKIVLASERKDIPKTYEQALLNFGLLSGLDESSAVRFSSFARLRNILTHQYLDVTYEKIRRFIQESPPVYDIVFAFLRKKI